MFIIKKVHITWNSINDPGINLRFSILISSSLIQLFLLSTTTSMNRKLYKAQYSLSGQETFGRVRNGLSNAHGEVSKALNYSHHLLSKQLSSVCIYFSMQWNSRPDSVYKVWQHMFKLRIKYMHTLLSHLESSVRHKHFL